MESMVVSGTRRRRPSRRESGMPYKVTVAAHHKLRIGLAAAHLETVGKPELAQVDDHRQRVRGDCAETERPCPFVGCSAHLFLDVNPNGSITFNFPHLAPWELARSCSLDEADLGGLTLEEVGERMNLTRERVRQVEVRALVNLKATPGSASLN